jgi:tetrahydromethanopterin S-methyltransferase subunit D
MVNMFSISPVSMMGSSMYGMNGMYAQGGNYHQAVKRQYGIGYEDSGATKPYFQGYPRAIVPKAPEPAVERNWLVRFVKKCFCL